MVFPKPYMRMNELVAMGISRSLLQRAYGDRAQRFAQKVSPCKRNSPIIYNTEGLAAWMDKDIQNQLRGMRRG